MAHRKPLASASMFPIAKPIRATPFEPQRRCQPGRHHPGIAGDNLLERERLEIRMMGEIISDQAGDTERNPHSGHASNSQTNSSPCPSSQCAVTLAADIPSPNSLRPLSTRSPPEVAAGPARSTSAVVATLLPQHEFDLSRGHQDAQESQETKSDFLRAQTSQHRHRPLQDSFPGALFRFWSRIQGVSN